MNHLQGCPAELEVFPVGQGLARSDDDRVAGVHAQRVEVLDTKECAFREGGRGDRSEKRRMALNSGISQCPLL